MATTDEDRAELEAMQRAGKKLGEGNWNPHLSIPSGINFLEVKTEGVRRLNFFSYLKTVAGGVFDVDKRAAYREYGFHKVGPQGTKALCPYTTFGKPCKMCQKKAEAFRDVKLNKEEKKAAATPFFVSKRRMYNVADADKDASTVLIYDVAENCFPETLDAKIDMAGEAMLAWNNPQRGKTLVVKFTNESTGGGGSFRKAANIEIVPRVFKYDKSLMDRIIDLDTLLVEVSNDDLWQMFMDGSGDDEEEEPDAEDGGRTNSQQVDDWAEAATSTKASAAVPADVEPEPEPEPEPDADAPEEEPFEEPVPELVPEPVKPVAKKTAAKPAAAAAAAAAPTKKAAPPKKVEADDGGWD